MRAAADTGRRPLLVLGAAVATAIVTLTGCAAGQQAQTAEQTSVVDGTAFQAGDVYLRDIGIRAPSGPAYAKGGIAFVEGILVNNGRDDDQLVSVSTPAATGVQFYADGVTAVIGLAPAPATTATDSVAPSGSATPSATGSGSASSSGAPTTTLTPGAPASAGASATPGASAGGSSAAGSDLAKTLQSVPLAATTAVRVGYDNTTVQIVLTGLTEDLAPAQTLDITFTFAKGGSVTRQIAVKLPTDASRSNPTIDVGNEGE